LLASFVIKQETNDETFDYSQHESSDDSDIDLNVEEETRTLWKRSKRLSDITSISSAKFELLVEISPFPRNVHQRSIKERRELSNYRRKITK